ncbi:MAG: TIGR02584 family CRISPR-associated protein, partial [Nitrosomonas sp.]|nr:TIGR02584 family CRISPR-associated protein [Nitrosomonas sp.]
IPACSSFIWLSWHYYSEDRKRALSDQQGLIADIRTPDENVAAADTITTLVAHLTEDDNAALHVSIAGGRKTMGFYLGYAFSLFARPQDNLSHILVSPLFENHPNFFYPPRQPCYLTARDGQQINTADAVVTLAKIPVVRLRHGLPETLVSGQAGYSETVTAVQKSFAPPRLLIDLEQRCVTCGDTMISMQPQLLAWLTWWAMLAKQKRPETTCNDADFQLFLDIYRAIVSIDAVDYEKAARLLNGRNKIIKQEFFQIKNSKMSHVLKKALGPAATPYLLITTGKRRNTRRGLSLPPDCIHISGITCT